MVPPASHRVSRVPWYSGYCCVTQAFVYGAFTLFGRLSQNRSTNLCESRMQSATPTSEDIGLASFPFARRYLGNHCCFLLLPLLRCFNSRRFPPYTYFIQYTVTEVRSAGFPHSDTHGSLVFYTSPWLFAVLCVLLRLLVPRHSPFALIRLTDPCTPSYV